jgi:hypothetical protein
MKEKRFNRTTRGIERHCIVPLRHGETSITFNITCFKSNNMNDNKNNNLSYNMSYNVSYNYEL